MAEINFGVARALVLFLWNNIFNSMRGWSPGSDSMSLANDVRSGLGFCPSVVEALQTTSLMILPIFLVPSSLNLDAVALTSCSMECVNLLWLLVIFSIAEIKVLVCWSVAPFWFEF